MVGWMVGESGIKANSDVSTTKYGEKKTLLGGWLVGWLVGWLEKVEIPEAVLVQARSQLLLVQGL